MSSRSYALMTLVGTVCAVVAWLLVKILAPHLVINHTTSLPRGLYWRTAANAETVERGNIVIVCIPHPFLLFAEREHMLEHGECDGLESMLKIVVGVAGDRVNLTNYGVTVNDGFVPNSKPFEHNPAGHVIMHVQHKLYKLQAGQVWLATPNPLSFDSRYYGPVTRVLAVAKPIFTF